MSTSRLTHNFHSLKRGEMNPKQFSDYVHNDLKLETNGNFTKVINQVDPNLTDFLKVYILNFRKFISKKIKQT